MSLHQQGSSETVRKELLARGRYYLIPSSGPAMIVGGPRLNMEQVSSFANTNMLLKLEDPATVHIAQLKGLLYVGPDKVVWPQSLFDMNIGDTVYVERTLIVEGAQPPTSSRTAYTVVFPFCLEIGAGARSHDIGVLLVERAGQGTREAVQCTANGKNASGKTIVTWSLNL